MREMTTASTCDEAVSAGSAALAGIANTRTSAQKNAAKRIRLKQKPEILGDAINANKNAQRGTLFNQPFKIAGAAQDVGHCGERTKLRACEKREPAFAFGLHNMRIRSFKALRPSQQEAPIVSAPPYDVVNTEEARAIGAGNPISLMHTSRAEIDFAPGQDPHADAVYAKAAENFKALIKSGHLKQDAKPCLYLYEQQMGGNSQKGIVALCSVEEYDNGTIRKHEKTRKDKEDDRTRLTDETSANLGPVFLTYRDDKKIDALVNDVAKTKPLFDFVDEGKVRHKGWQIPGGEELVKLFASVPRAYIADGHHRAASAARVGRTRREKNPNHTGNEAYNNFLAVLFPASQLRILPYNRLVADLKGKSPKEFLNALKKVGTLTENAPASPTGAANVSIYIEGKWYGLRFDEPWGNDPVSSLDVSMLQDRVLAPVLGIDDPRTSERISFVGGIRGTKYLEKEVDEGRAAVAFSMYPTSVKQLMDIADADQIMPPKSTWFEPKLRSGLFINIF
jgi:uncharacterized protein (DUF1015 family)